MFTVDQVLQIIAEKVIPVAAHPVSLAAAEGAVLASPIVMDQDSPAFDRAQLDGFAVKSSDAREGERLQLIGQIDAGGAPFRGVINPGQCAGINTGAMMPQGADAVLMVEHSEKMSAPHGDFIKAKRTVPPGYGVRPRGADAAKGAIVLHAGVRLFGPQLAACAAAGVGTPSVRSIRIAVLSTGDELVDVTADPLPLPLGKIRNSNHPMLSALARDAIGPGGVVLNLGTSPDEITEVRTRLLRGLTEADLLIVAGGMSMGTRDLVPPLLKELGVHFHVEKVKMKPGKPFVLGTWEGQKGATHGRTYVAGLPGNPVSAYVTFQRFVREMIHALSGVAAPALRRIRALTELPLEPNGDREFFQPCTLHQNGATSVAKILPWKGSADLFTLAQSDALLVRPPHAPKAEASSEVDVLLTSWR